VATRFTGDTSSVTFDDHDAGRCDVVVHREPGRQPSRGPSRRFAACKIDKTGTYTLTAADGVLTSAQSSSLTISRSAAAAKVAFHDAAVGLEPAAVAFPTQPGRHRAGTPVGNTVHGATPARWTFDDHDAGRCDVVVHGEPEGPRSRVWATFRRGCNVDLEGRLHVLTAGRRFVDLGAEHLVHDRSGSGGSAEVSASSQSGRS